MSSVKTTTGSGTYIFENLRKRKVSIRSTNCVMKSRTTSYTFIRFNRPLDPQKKAFIAGLGSKPENSESKVEKEKSEKAAGDKGEKSCEMKKSSTKEQLVHTHAIKNSAVISAFYKLLQHSYRNVPNTGRRVLITLDARERYMNGLCFENKSVTCMEAALIIALSFLKAEKDVTIAVFNESSLTLVPTEKGKFTLKFL